MDSALEEKSGYIKKSSVVGFAKATGFELVDKSSVNANPKDSHDWPEGVWTLPPTLKKGDVDREKYQAVGESDRMMQIGRAHVCTPVTNQALVCRLLHEKKNNHNI